jgi:glycosyltransferase involved in cell wall biosynthesis
MYPFKKVFTTFHGYESYPIKSSAIRVRKLSEILSNGNICIGDFITKWYGTHPTYISYGATQIVKKPSVNDSKTALFYGRLDDQTGIETYIEGFKKIKKSIKDFELLVIGNGVYEEDVQKITKRIDFKENLSQEINSHNILFVSRYLSILEALAAQRLVIAVYDNPVKRDYLQMAPFAKFIEICETSDEVAEKVIYYLKNPDEKNRKIELGYQWATQQTWENLTSLYLKLWNT